jgi:TPP-dependent pyruvate/acetoin dehydrogenase alpha subunit
MEANRKIELLRQMMLVRHFEDAWGRAYTNEEIEGIPPSLGTGQEAVSVGACAALSEGDFVFTTHRGQAPQLARGLDPRRVMADLYCKRTGYNKGKSYHVTDLSRGVIGMGGIIGAQVPVAAGIALANAMKRSDRVSLAFFGDGAANEGVVQETIVLASMWKLPLVLVCENNGYCITQRVSDAVKGDGIAGRAQAAGLAQFVVNGNDPIAVHDAVADAVKRAREGGGATLVEAQTLRLAGHLVHDVQRYRDAKELAAGWENCPIATYGSTLEREGLLDPAARGALEASIVSEVAIAVEFARQSSFPEPREAFEDLWA